MSFPLDGLLFHDWPQLGLLVAVLVGVGFGGVLERAGFGRATKLAAQFYLSDMTVLKVMFGAIVTAALGTVIADGIGLIELRPLASQAASWTYLGPMLAGGLLLGVGFIVSGYCPGTSVVAAASGNIDGLVTLLGVGIGCFLFAETRPLLGTFVESGNLEHLFLYDLLHLPAAVIAAGVTVAAIGAFVAADAAERRFGSGPGDQDADRRAPGPRRFAFASFGVAAAVGLALMAVPESTSTSTEPRGSELLVIDPQELAHRLIEEPWTVRILDLRTRDECAERRVPGAECAPLDTLGDIGLAYASPDLDLVLVGEGTVEPLPRAATAYRGEVFVLDGGFASWEAFALTEPTPPDAPRDSPLWDRYRLRAGLHSALTGTIQAPPPATPTTTFVPAPRTGEGGCG
jgi:hypothetical protein